jgi:hypothetical protein
MTPETIFAAAELLVLSAAVAGMTWLNYRVLRRLAAGVGSFRNAAGRSAAAASPSALGLEAAR